jgi:hypothetical protein
MPYNVRPCCLERYARLKVSKDRAAFFFRVKQSTLLVLLDPKDGGIIVIQKFGIYLPCDTA